ncbi:uncharacterized protein LACBIDRAFT_329458 [Laccaria bicolor S238N-H82]|uniref:Predicted protein n=1 Tax=Laccaria bicolor (strain S238N-H82 / ATCC MYA-4686) TaxID=486041 RepID=B0DI34_LACBS|nr:uncharacterized protein LACBIDRAFT_329458 [Laccaria bicolor S238N-H82]EDR05839.1 predicted protein [Laccaria bicolor S238N-H82]|eukprot:XP_001883515.1 predicted protein [Laccaria bicolor S238N-H82]
MLTATKHETPAANSCENPAQIPLLLERGILQIRPDHLEGKVKELNTPRVTLKHFLLSLRKRVCELGRELPLAKSRPTPSWMKSRETRARLVPLIKAWVDLEAFIVFLLEGYGKRLTSISCFQEGVRRRLRCRTRGDELIIKSGSEVYAAEKSNLPLSLRMDFETTYEQGISGYTTRYSGELTGWFTGHIILATLVQCNHLGLVIQAVSAIMQTFVHEKAVSPTKLKQVSKKEHARERALDDALNHPYPSQNAAVCMTFDVIDEGIAEKTAITHTNLPLRCFPARHRGIKINYTSNIEGLATMNDRTAEAPEHCDGGFEGKHDEFREPKTLVDMKDSLSGVMDRTVSLDLGTPEEDRRWLSERLRRNAATFRATGHHIGRLEVCGTSFAKGESTGRQHGIQIEAGVIEPSTSPGAFLESPRPMLDESLMSRQSDVTPTLSRAWLVLPLLNPSAEFAWLTLQSQALRLRQLTELPLELRNASTTPGRIIPEDLTPFLLFVTFGLCRSQLEIEPSNEWGATRPENTIQVVTYWSRMAMRSTGSNYDAREYETLGLKEDLVEYAALLVGARVHGCANRRVAAWGAVTIAVRRASRVCSMINPLSQLLQILLYDENVNYRVAGWGAALVTYPNPRIVSQIEQEVISLTWIGHAAPVPRELMEVPILEQQYGEQHLSLALNLGWYFKQQLLDEKLSLLAIAPESRMVQGA